MKSNRRYHGYCGFRLTPRDLRVGYSVCGYGYGVGKPDLRVTCSKPYSEPLAETSIDGFDDLAAITNYVDWEYDCGYEGGVNREDSDTEYQPGSSSDDSQWDAESLDELSGDELESNLQQQRELLAEVAALTAPTPYSQITAPKTKAQWARWSKTEH